MVLGGTNTLVGAAALYVLSGLMPATVAWTVTYAVGITFVMLVTPGFVFGANARWSRRLLLGGWYVCTYLVGLGVIALLQSVASVPRIVIVLVTVAVTAPLGFVGGRFLVGQGYGLRTSPPPAA
jgi:putative flippase GtrA